MKRRVVVMRLTVLIEGEGEPQFPRVLRIGVESGITSSDGHPVARMLDVLDGFVESSETFADYAASQP